MNTSSKKQHETHPTPLEGKMREKGKFFTFILPVILLAVGGLVAWGLLVSAPEHTTSPTLPPAPVVEVISVVQQSHEVEVVSFGNIIPAREVQLAPEVMGRVIEVNESVQPGGHVAEGSVLFRIDPSDYKLAVDQALATLEGSEADLAMEEGRGLVAQAEWESFLKDQQESDASQEASSLALREPQIRQVQANVAAARTALAQAELNLKRTTVLSPFDATILEESLEIGQRVGPNDPVVHLVGTKTFWAEITMPANQINRLQGLNGVEAKLTLIAGSNGGDSRTGRFVRLLPSLDPQGRMARALVAVDDPLGMNSDQPFFPLDGYVQVTLRAGSLENSVRAPRESIRENNQVWVRDAAGLLQIRNIEVLWRNEQDVLLRGDFQADDQLIISYLNESLPGQTIAVRESQ